MSWVRTLAAIVLLLALFPGAGEAIENAVHLVGFGHAAHAAGTGHGHGAPGAEHGCNGSFHLCSCCAQVTGVLSLAVRLTGAPTRDLDPARLAPRPLDVDLPGTRRPPRT
ncbi:MAG: hypothetical protein KJ058_01905 [Thermoanaerobaculia bacterium]|nr:hypothetical protein [Thermoanaerobaculia bacterium]